MDVSFIKIATPRQTDNRTSRALFVATLNLTFLNENVGILEIMSKEIIKTHKITHNGYNEIAKFTPNLSRINSNPSGISINPAAAGAGTPIK